MDTDTFTDDDIVVLSASQLVNIAETFVYLASRVDNDPATVLYESGLEIDVADRIIAAVGTLTWAEHHACPATPQHGNTPINTPSAFSALTDTILYAAAAEIHHRFGGRLDRYWANITQLAAMNVQAEEISYYDDADEFATDLREDAQDLLDAILGALRLNPQPHSDPF